MSDFQVMATAARDAMIHVLGLAPADKVLLVTDEKTSTVAQAFHSAASTHGCPVEIYLLPEAERPLANVPTALRELLEGTNVVLNLFEARPAEVPFRIEWLLEIEATKRIILGHSPGITPSMLTEGPLNVDYDAMADLAARLIQGFAKARTVHITTPAGTDLVLDITDRPFVSDVKATIEHGSNLPCGEIFCAPVETGANGVLVIDGSFADTGPPPTHVRFTLEDGEIKDLVCDDAQIRAKVKELTGSDDEARVIGELGIGINPGASQVGNMLQDEKAYRTAHIAFGNNADFPGGRNRSRVHFDFLFQRPTFVVTYGDGSTRMLMEKGEFLV